MPFIKKRNGFLTAGVLLLLLLAFGSCKSTKKIQAAISKKDTATMLITNQSENDSILLVKKVVSDIKGRQTAYKTFSAKIKAEYEDVNGKQPNITVYIRLIKDSLMWISGYATVFNIEAFRVLINKDSVFVLDKINKTLQLRSIDYLQEVTQIPFDFTTLQDLLVGNPVFFTDSVVSYKETGTKILLATIGNSFKHLLTLDRETHFILHSKLDDVDVNRNRTADLTYDEFENNNGISFSTFREITVSEKNKLDIQLKFKQYEFNKELQINFSIPKNYKRR
jgi:outer membrane lipoprotein-sorting protein